MCQSPYRGTGISTATGVELNEDVEIRVNPLTGEPAFLRPGFSMPLQSLSCVNPLTGEPAFLRMRDIVKSKGGRSVNPLTGEPAFLPPQRVAS